MATRATDIYRRFAPQMQIGRDACQAMVVMTRLVDIPEDLRRINAERWPKIVISASGMATGSRVFDHLENMALDARNAIVFCVFQAGGTRGASLIGGAPQCAFTAKMCQSERWCLIWIPCRRMLTVVKSLISCCIFQTRQSRPSSPMVSRMRPMRCGCKLSAACIGIVPCRSAVTVSNWKRAGAVRCVSA